MQLRFVEDRRTLVWAFVLFPLLPLLAYVKPQLFPWLVPLALYCSYCAGVLAHNHNHCGVFVSRRVNLAYGAWLSFFYGFPLFGWVPTHNQNHHRYLNGAGDVARTSRHAGKDTLLAALSYPLACSRWQLPLVWRYARDAFTSRPARRARLERVLLECSVVLLGHLGACALACSLHGLSLGLLIYFGAVGAPALLATYWMMLTNYLQHVGCDAGSAHDHSRNFVAPFWNWFVFDNGLHTVHHQNPGLHWSRYRALHELSRPLIQPRLNHDSLLGYVQRRYFSAARR